MRVGRAPIDEEAIRLLEQHNPDIEFDWTRILKDPPPEPGVRRDRDPRDRDRRDRRDPRPPQRPFAPAPATQAPTVPPSPTVIHAQAADVAEERAAAHADVVLAQQGGSTEVEATAMPQDETAEFAGEESLAVGHSEPLAADHAEYLEYAAASGHLDTDATAAEPVEPREPGEPGEPGEPREPEVSSAAAARLGAEGLVRLRARFSEIMARIAEKPMDEPAREELKAKAERLNPDAWVTTDEVAAALEQYETVFESLAYSSGSLSSPAQAPVIL